MKGVYTTAALVAAAAAQPYAEIAGYAPGSDVVEHNKLDLDVKEFGAELVEGDWEEAKAIYTTGKNSAKTSGLRNLKAFSNNAEKLKGEPMADLYAAYWGGDYAYADTFVTNAIDGTGPFTGLENVARKELALKGAQYQSVWMYVVHELEDALNDCRASTIARNDAGVHAWDEGWAFYTGSLELHDGSGSGQMLYSLADKRCANYGTCVDESGMSFVNLRLLSLFQQGEEALQEGRCSVGAALLKEIKPLMTVPLIQGALRYAYKTDPAGPVKGGAKEQAEGWAFTAAVLPQVDAVSPAAAALIRRNMEHYGGGSAPVADGYRAVYSAFQSVYAGLGISCDDIGGLVDDSVTGKYLPVYYPGTETCSDFIATTSALLTDTVAPTADVGESITIVWVFIVINMILGLVALGMALQLKKGNRRAIKGFAPVPSESGSRSISIDVQPRVLPHSEVA